MSFWFWIINLFRRRKLPAKFVIHIQLERMNMNEHAAAAIDIQLADDGTATATLSYVDSAGYAATLPAGASVAPPSWTTSNPALVATPAVDGLSAKLTVNVSALGSPLPTGLTVSVSSAVMTLADSSTKTLAGATSKGIDITSGGPAGFSIAISEP